MYESYAYTLSFWIKKIIFALTFENLFRSALSRYKWGDEGDKKRKSAKNPSSHELLKLVGP